MTLCISTDDVPVRDRRAFWSDMVCALLVRADCAAMRTADGFEGHIEQRLLTPGLASCDAISVSRIRSRAQTVRHEKRHLSQVPHDQVLVNIQCAGTGVVQQDGRETVLRPGDLAVYTSDRPYELAFDAAFEQTVIVLPAASVRTVAPTLQRWTARRMDARNPCGSLLRQVAQQALRRSDGGGYPHLGRALVHLLAAMLAEQDGSCGIDCREQPAVDPPIALSPREEDVLHLMARGMTYEEVARHLALSITTVRSYVRSLYEKLGAHNKTEAVFEARQCGWLV